VLFSWQKVKVSRKPCVTRVHARSENEKAKKAPKTGAFWTLFFSFLLER
jgi:hypothetical protein